MRGGLRKAMNDPGPNRSRRSEIQEALLKGSPMHIQNVIRCPGQQFLQQGGLEMTPNGDRVKLLVDTVENGIFMQLARFNFIPDHDLG